MDQHQLPTMNCEYNDPHRTKRSSQDNELDPQGCCSMSRCSMPSLTVHRFVALIFLSLLGFGYHFCYNNPSNLYDVLSKKLNLAVKDYVWLYYIGIYPNVVMCFVGGFLIDHVLGTRLGTIIYVFVVLIGQLVFATGGQLNIFWLMLCGRFIFGSFADALSVAQNKYAVLWFKDKELNMVFGLQLLIQFLGSALNSKVMQPIYDRFNKFSDDHHALGGALLLAAVTCLLSFICALILGCMDKSTQPILQRSNKASGKLPRLTDIFPCRIAFWMVAVIWVAYYVALLGFLSFAQQFFTLHFELEYQEAFSVYSSLYPVAAFASPIFGIVIDRTGRNVIWVFAAILSLIGAHLLLAFTLPYPYVVMIFMGLAYSILTPSLWGLVALIIPEHQLGTAYGICLSVQNLGVTLSPIVVGIIVDKTRTYIWMEVFFLGWLAIALIATCGLWAYDVNTKGNLNMTPRQRAKNERSTCVNF